MKIENSRVQCIVPAADICGEGAVWSPEQSALYWTDINRFLVHRYTPADQSTRTWFFDEPVTTVNLTTDADRLLLVLGSRIGLWSPATHPKTETIFRLSSSPGMRFNDAGVDARGSLWAGTMRNNVGPDGEELDVSFADGVLYRIDPDHSVTEWKHNIGISNTVAWSPDHSAFYFGDSVANAIYRFDFDRETGEISGETLFLRHHRGAPDGSAMDAEGFLWNTRPGAGCLVRVAPDGSIDRTVELPVSNPTTCTFGEDDFKNLYITSARSPDQFSGGLFALETDVPGMAKGRFRVP